MAAFRFTLTVPQIEENWWKKSRKELTDIVTEYNKENWANATDPVDNSRWKPRKPPTGTWPLLNKTGRMFGSTVIVTRATEPMIFTAKIGVDYGGFHQYGTSRMPRRRWLGIGPSIADRMAAVIGKNIFSKSKTYRI